MKKILLLCAVVVALLSLTLAGCSGGVPQADYDALLEQLAQAHAENAALADVESSYQQALADNEELTRQLNDLKAQYELTGLSPAEMAEKIVQNYHATHTYSKTDMFICSDMSSEVWNMLKAVGIDAVIVIGNPDVAVADILQSNHAWVLADVGNGDKLALETTGGFVVPRAENANYYRGWTFSSPTNLKSNNDLIREYNLRVGFRNLLADEVNTAMGLYNNSTNQVEADKYMLLYTTLKDFKDAQEAILLQLKAQIDGLASIL